MHTYTYTQTIIIQRNSETLKTQHSSGDIMYAISQS